MRPKWIELGAYLKPSDSDSPHENLCFYQLNLKIEHES